jgi:dTDP-glucose 4,6-dehydratase
LTGTDKQIVFKPLPKNDPLQRKPDITTAKQILGWTPQIERGAGMKITYDYFKSLSVEELNKLKHRDFSSFKA